MDGAKRVAALEQACARQGIASRNRLLPMQAHGPIMQRQMGLRPAGWVFALMRWLWGKGCWQMRLRELLRVAGTRSGYTCCTGRHGHVQGHAWQGAAQAGCGQQAGGCLAVDCPPRARCGIATRPSALAAHAAHVTRAAHATYACAVQAQIHAHAKACPAVRLARAVRWHCSSQPYNRS